MEPRELFAKLESNNGQVVEEVKKQFHDCFNQTKESWLVNNLIDCYLSSESLRLVEILVGVREPHDKFVFEKLLDLLRNAQSSKLKTLTLLGDIVRRQPMWLHKISQHSLFKELLKILKSETDILVLMSALLVLIVLLPMIPAYVGPYLNDIFEVFSRLAAWNTNNPSKLSEDQLVHLQVSLHALFHRLYGMYPCNFLSYLQTEYSIRENLGIFSHTIKPMLETVKMHPLLVTASKDVETATYRWKSMEHHDVVVECAKFAVDIKDDGNVTCAPNKLSHFSTDTNRKISDVKWEGFDLKDISLASHDISLKPLPPMLPDISEPTSIPHTSYVLSTSFPHQEGTSPPEAAIEATPETTPVKDHRHVHRVQPSVNSTVVRALNNFAPPKWNTPNQSQPSSPMKKETSPFGFPDHLEKVHKRLQDRGLNTSEPTSPLKIEPNSAGSTGVGRNGFSFDEFDDHGEARLRSHNSVNEINDDCEEEIGSPCTQGGLHMPDSRSVIDFHKGVNRLRHLSYSATNDVSHLEMNQVRKSCSCPEIEKDRPSLSSYDTNDVHFNETDEEGEPTVVNGSVELARYTTAATQTNEPLMSYPYGHMFLSVFPNIDQHQDKVNTCCPTSMLDKYVETAASLYGDVKKNIVHNLEQELKEVKEQLVLMHLQLKFERHRREVHAERNRRLLGKSRNNRYLEEHNSALREQLALVEKDIESLNGELSIKKTELRNEELKLQQCGKQWQEKFTALEKKNGELKTENEDLKNELLKARLQHGQHMKEIQAINSKYFEVANELKQVSAQVSAGVELKDQVQYLQKELILVGELQQKQRERLLSLNAKREQSALFSQDGAAEEIKVVNSLLESKTSTSEAMRSRITELESTLTRKDMLVGEQKRTLKVVKAECQEQLKALDDKYETQRAINRKLEEIILELNTKLEAHSKRNKRSVSTAQDVLSLAEERGFNSPLSISLSSSEGVSISGVISDSLHMRDLRSIIDIPEKVPDEFEDFDSFPRNDPV